MIYVDFRPARSDLRRRIAKKEPFVRSMWNYSIFGTSALAVLCPAGCSILPLVFLLFDMIFFRFTRNVFVHNTAFCANVQVPYFFVHHQRIFDVVWRKVLIIVSRVLAFTAYS